MGVGRYSRALRGLGVIAMSDAGLDIMRSWIQCDALRLSVVFLQLLVCYDCLHPAQLLWYLLIITVYGMGWKSCIE